MYIIVKNKRSKKCHVGKFLYVAKVQLKILTMKFLLVAQSFTTIYAVTASFTTIYDTFDRNVSC